MSRESRRPWPKLPGLSSESNRRIYDAGPWKPSTNKRNAVRSVWDNFESSAMALFADRERREVEAARKEREEERSRKRSERGGRVFASKAGSGAVTLDGVKVAEKFPIEAKALEFVKPASKFKSKRPRRAEIGIVPKWPVFYAPEGVMTVVSDAREKTVAPGVSRAIVEMLAQSSNMRSVAMRLLDRSDEFTKGLLETCVVNFTSEAHAAYVLACRSMRRAVQVVFGAEGEPRELLSSLVEGWRATPFLVPGCLARLSDFLVVESCHAARGVAKCLTTAVESRRGVRSAVVVVFEEMPTLEDLPEFFRLLTDTATGDASLSCIVTVDASTVRVIYRSNEKLWCSSGSGEVSVRNEEVFAKHSVLMLLVDTGRKDVKPICDDVVEAWWDPRREPGKDRDPGEYFSGAAIAAEDEKLEETDESESTSESDGSSDQSSDADELDERARDDYGLSPGNQIVGTTPGGAKPRQGTSRGRRSIQGARSQRSPRSLAQGDPTSRERQGAIRSSRASRASQGASQRASQGASRAIQGASRAIQGASQRAQWAQRAQRASRRRQGGAARETPELDGTIAPRPSRKRPERGEAMPGERKRRRTEP